MQLTNPFPLSDFLLQEGHRYHDEFFESYQSNLKGDQAGKTTWQAKTIAYCTDRKINLSKARVSANTRASRWYNTLPTREQMALAVMHAENPELCGADIGQSIERVFKSQDGIIASLIPGNKIWMYFKDRPERLLYGIEQMMLTGFPLDILETAIDAGAASDRLFKDFAGNAFTGSIAEAILISVLIHTLPEHIAELNKSVSGADRSDAGSDCSSESGDSRVPFWCSA